MTEPGAADVEEHGALLRRFVVSILVIGMVLGAGWAAFSRLTAGRDEPPRAPGGPPLPVVRVERLRLQDYQEVLRGYGVARPLREARVAAEVAGVVRHLAPNLRLGAAVEPPATTGNGGPSDLTPLVQLDSRDIEDSILRLAAERRQIEADLARSLTDVTNLDRQLAVAARRLETSKAESARIERLVEGNTLPESELDRQRLALFALEQMESELRARRDQTAAQRGVLDARLEALDVQARQARRDRDRTRIYAPFAGRVTVRHVEIGSRVVPGTPLFDLVDPSQVEVGVALPAGRHLQVDVGSGVTLRLRPGGPVAWRGEVARVSPSIDPATRTFRLWVEVRSEGVAPGAPVIADVEGARHEGVLAVPREAFLDLVVYVAEPGDVEGEAVTRQRRPEVETLLPEFALVRPTTGGAGLAAGDVVVVSNLEDIAEGSHIKIVTTAEASSGP